MLAYGITCTRCSCANVLGPLGDGMGQSWDKWYVHVSGNETCLIMLGKMWNSELIPCLTHSEPRITYFTMASYTNPWIIFGFYWV